jgi:hypothetical protein
MSEDGRNVILIGKRGTTECLLDKQQATGNPKEVSHREVIGRAPESSLEEMKTDIWR